MNLQNSHSKKYVLTFFMSTCLLASSFLSMEVRAASFTQLANQIPALSGLSETQRKNEWNKYSLVTKQTAWKKAKLVPSLDQAILDVQNGFDPKLLSDSNENVRHTARKKNAEITLYIVQIEQPDYDKKFNEYINLKVIPTPEEVGQSLRIDYDPQKINNKIEKDQKIRRAEKDKKAVIDRYIELVKIISAEKEYTAAGRVPELDELAKKLNIDKVKAKLRRTIIRDQVMENKKAELITIGKIPTQKELNKLFGEDREADDKKYTNDIRTHVMHDKKQEYINNNNPLPTTDEISNRFNIKKFGADYFLKQIESERTKGNNSQNTTKPVTKHSRTTTNTAGISSGLWIPFDTGRTKPETKSFDFRGSVTRLIDKKFKDPKGLNFIERHLKRYKDISEFKEFLEDNKPIEALEFAEKRELGDSYKKQAISAIYFNNYDIIKTIFFTVNNSGTRTILNTVLTNSSLEEKAKIVERIKDYAIQNIFNNQFEGKPLLDLIKLAASKDKSSVEKFLALQLELKNNMQPFFEQNTYSLTLKEVEEINTKLKNNRLITNSLTKDDMIKLTKVNSETVIKIILSDSTGLSDETNKILGLAVGNNANNLEQTQSGIPNPPPLPLNGSMPPPPPPLNSQGFISNSNNFDLNKLQAEYPHIHSLYTQFTRNTTVQPKASLQPTASSATSTERSEPETAYAKLYAEYRTETGGKKADNLQDQLIKRQADLTNVIRQILTKFYSDQGANTKTLATLFSKPNPEITKKAKEIFNTLGQDPYIQDIIADGKKIKITTRKAILDALFNESGEDARERLLLPSSKVTEQHRKDIILYNTTTNFNTIKKPLEKLLYAHKHKNVLGEKVFDNTFDKLITNPKILTFSDQIHFLIQNYENLDISDEQKKYIKNISDEQKKAIEDSILSTIEIKDLATDTQISPQNLVKIIQQKNPDLLLKLLEARVIIEENQLAKLKSVIELDDELTTLLSFMNACPEDLKILANKVTIGGINGALRDKWKQESKAKTNNTQKPPVHNNDIPILSTLNGAPPPPPPPMTNSNSNFDDYLIKNIASQELIYRLKKLLKAKSNFTTDTSAKDPSDFSPKSEVGQKYYIASTPTRLQFGEAISNTQKLDRLIKEKMQDEYLYNINKKLTKNAYIVQEVFDTAHSDFIGPRTELGQEIHYKLFNEAIQEAFDTAHSDFIGPRTELGQEIHYKLFNEAIQEAFDTAHSDFIGPRTELGQEIHELYERQLLELANDKEFIKYVKKTPGSKELLPFIEELEKNQPELEQKYGSEVQPENSNNEKKVGSLNMKQFQSLFQQENESANDESSTKDDTQPEDSNKKSEKSDSTTALSPRLLSSSDSKNDKSSDEEKSLLALSSSDEEDKGYETDEELEESNSTTDEESKKDIVLESEDEAIDVSFKTEAIAEQDEATQRQQVSDDTSRKVAILNAASTLHKHVHPSILTNRLNVTAIGAGDEEASINRGLWISGLYGINKQGAWKNIPKYQGRITGITIGADAEFINSDDVIGIAYSRLESQIKYNKKLGKTAVNGHLLSIYGLKELIKGFSLQAITSYGHNYIKNKSKTINNIIGKYQNNNLAFESLLNYKYRTKYDLHFIPNIGFKYDYSRASNYKEYNVDIENLMIQKKSNQLFESSLGGKIVFKPIVTTSNIVLTPSLYGNIERHFNNKNTKVNAKATFKGQILQEIIIIPKQPKLGYNIGSNILVSRKNINVLFEYNYYTHKKYQSHQGLIKLKVNL